MSRSGIPPAEFRDGVGGRAARMTLDAFMRSERPAGCPSIGDSRPMDPRAEQRRLNEAAPLLGAPGCRCHAAGEAQGGPMLVTSDMLATHLPLTQLLRQTS